LAEREKERRTHGKSKTLLTGGGLLMEGTDSRGTRRTCSFMTSGNPTQGARE
jgi:hypothetical protein